MTRPQTPANSSLAASLASLPPEQQKRLLARLTPERAIALAYDWRFWARPNQLTPDGHWQTWLLLAGRGFGKTRTGAEEVRARVAAGYRRVALVAPTAADARDVMVEGESGLLSIHPPGQGPKYEPSKRRLTWPNGAIATTYSADEPERLRGPQHDFAWCFIAGTLIATNRGERPIEEMAVGDLVWTRDGLRAVAGAASHYSAVGSVAFSHGRSLTGTADHPVLTQRGFIRLADLRRGEAVCVTNAWNGAASAGTDTARAGISSFAAPEASADAIARDFTAQCGAPPSEKSRPDTTFTISTATERTTPSKTWPVSGTAIIKAFMSLRRRFDNIVGRINQISTQAVHVAVPPSNESSREHQYATDADGAGPTQSGPSPEHACAADRYSEQFAAGFAASVVSTWAPVGLRRVFNLRVESPPEYFANGILVHNCDELASWRYPEAWDMLMFGLRLGSDPRVVVTTTPKPIKSVRELLADPTTFLTRGSTFENRSNLADSFFTQIIRKYEGTRLGRQELDAEILDDTPGALWRMDLIERARVTRNAVPTLTRIVVAIDPAASAGEDADETGIIVAGRTAGGHGYVLHDGSGRMMPHEWAAAAVKAYRDHGADRIVAEINQGGDMVESTIRMVDPSVPYSGVRASRGKVVRAEPVAALYEQERVHHVGAFPQLEDQMCAFAADFDRDRAGYSPDRVDALVWAFTELMVEPMPGAGIYGFTRQIASEIRATPVPERPKAEPAKGSREWEELHGGRK